MKKGKYDTNQLLFGSILQRTEYHLQPLQQYIFANIQLQPEEMNVEHVELQNRQNGGNLYKRKRVKFYQNSPNLHFACDFGEVLVFRGTHRLPFDSLKATAEVRSACLGPGSKSKG